MTFMAWPEIESFHNIRKFMHAYPELLNGQSKVAYCGKLKLHGTNAAVQVRTDGTVVAQSRTAEISVSNDNAGFARWVKENEDFWKNATPGYIYFGEWFGPGVQKGVACSEVPRKSFALFSARPLQEGNDDLSVEPTQIEDLINSQSPGNGSLIGPDTYILPWHETVIEINWADEAALLQQKVDLINKWVLDVEVNDPWIEVTFGVKGTGEGLVFYPRSGKHIGMTNFTNLVFKAKGEKHKNIKTAAPAQVDASAANDINQFADMVLTQARLEQGARAVGGFDLTLGITSFDMKLIGKFIAWVASDVEKETQDELVASNLTFKQVQKAVGDKARAWYIEQFKKL